ncbi:MAG: hypothetical protein LBS98_00290 [Coriobacteriales bacterium]|nr:hypothetical protein [Coriobacteriales bacterium]
MSMNRGSTSVTAEPPSPPVGMQPPSPAAAPRPGGRSTALVLTLVVLALLVVSVFIPRIGLPIFGGVDSLGTWKGLLLVFENIGNDGYLVVSPSWEGVWETVKTGGTGLLAVFLGVLCVGLSVILMLIAALIHAILALYQTTQDDRRRALKQVRRGAWYIFVSFVFSNATILLLNIYINSKIQGGVMSLGLVYESLTYVAPSSFSWMLLASALVLVVICSVLNRRQPA